MNPQHLACVLGHHLLHSERCVASTDRMILMGKRRPEEGHYAVPHHSVHSALVMMNGRHHVVEYRVEKLLRLFCVAIRDQFHRAANIGKEHGYKLSLAFKRAFGNKDFFRKMAGSVVVR